MMPRLSREELRCSVEACVARRAAFHPSSAGRGSVGALDVAAGILDLWPQDLVARVTAGISVAELERRLQPHGLSLGIDAPDPERSTLGGLWARAEAGRGAAPNETLRSRLLGLTALDGKARLLKAGARVVKNVAGYDLARLHHGAQGAFGLVLDLTLRLSALPQTRALRAFECEVDRLPQLLDALRRPKAHVDPDRVSWFDARATARLGFAAGPLLVLELNGSTEFVTEWTARVGGEAFHQLEAARDFDVAGLRLDWSCPLREFVTAWPAVSEAFCLRADPMSGRHRLVLLAGEAAPRHELETLGRQSRERGGSLYAAEPWLLPPVPTRRDPVALRLKAAFDPHGLLPAVPEAIG